MTTITLAGDYGHTDYRARGLDDGTVVDATGARWTLQNSRADPDAAGCDTGDGPVNRYPVQIRDGGKGIVVLGGTIAGEVPQDTDWRNTYTDKNTGASCNSAAVRFVGCESPTLEGWRIDGFWDAIRLSENCNGWRVRKCHVSNGRDDAIENDKMLGGVVEDTLIDGVFVGISMDSGSDPIDGSMNEVVIDGVLMRMQPYHYRGEYTHQSPLKIQSDIARVPGIRIRNSVIAIADVNHEGRKRLQRGWDRTIESVGNHFLNLSDDPLPGDYPLPPDGFTVLQGRAARDYWAAAMTAWLNGGVAPTPEPEPECECSPEPDPAPEPEPDPAPATPGKGRNKLRKRK